MAFVMPPCNPYRRTTQGTSNNGEPSPGLMSLVVAEQQKQQRRQFQLLCRRKSWYQRQKGTLLQVSSRTLSLGYLPVTRKWIMLDTERQRLQARISGGGDDHHHHHDALEEDEDEDTEEAEEHQEQVVSPHPDENSTTSPQVSPCRNDDTQATTSMSVEAEPAGTLPSTPVRKSTNIHTPTTAPPASTGNKTSTTGVKPVSSMIFTRAETVQENNKSRYHLNYKSSLSNLFLKRKKKVMNILVNLPAEVLQQTCSYLPQEDNYSMALVHSGISPFAYDDLYREPKFISTYRLAQFVSTITHNENLARLVRVINLSELQYPEQGNRIFAGWRDWKYREESIYHVCDDARPSSNSIGLFSPLPKYNHHHHHQRDKKNSFMQQNYTSCARRNASVPGSMSLHPSLSPLLKQYSLVKDVPFGYIMHLALACRNITMIDLSMVPLSEDYEVNSYRHRPSSFTNKIFVSDVPRVNTWKDGETKRILRPQVIETIMSLENLHTLRLRNLVWVGEDIVHKIVFEGQEEEQRQHQHAASKSVPSSPNISVESIHENNNNNSQPQPPPTRRRSSSLKNVDFSDCGMSKGKSWAINGSLDDVKSILLGKHNTKSDDDEEDEDEDENLY